MSRKKRKSHAIPALPTRAGRAHAAAKEAAHEAAQWQALDLRIKGLSYRRIAETMLVSTPTAFRYVQSAQASLREAIREKAEELRDLELARLDALTETYHPRAVEGDMAAAALCIKVSESRRKLLGIDAPTEQRVEVTTAQPPALIIETSGHPALAPASPN